jgi:hypothetical protein
MNVASSAGALAIVGDGGPATAAPLNLNNGGGLVVDKIGNVYIANSGVHNIRKIDTFGIITTIGGSIVGTPGSSGDGGPATAALLYTPLGMDIDSAGNIYIADQTNNKIRMISPAGIMTTVVGTGSGAYSGDGGLALAARLYFPRDIKFDIYGNMFIADANNNVIRKVDKSNIITTIAGTGVAANTGDGGLAIAAGLNTPARIAYDGASNLYFSDQANHTIRKISLASGIISKVAGVGVSGFSGDNGPATNANLAGPAGVGADRFGNFFIADISNQRIRVVPSQGSVAIKVASIGGSHVCVGTPLFFKAYASVIGALVYHWQKNGVDISVTSTDTFTATSVANNDAFRCVVYVIPVCGTSFYDTSNVVTANVDLPAATITSVLGTDFMVIAGQSVTLSNGTPGGTWVSSSPLVAVIGSTSGVVTGILAGTTNITYSVTNVCGVTQTITTGTVTPLPSVHSRAGYGGTISPSGMWYPSPLTGVISMTYNIAPNAGYRIKNVWIDSSNILGSLLVIHFRLLLQITVFMSLLKWLIL